MDEKIQILGQILSNVPFQKTKGDEIGICTQGDNNNDEMMSFVGQEDYPFTILAHTLSHESSKFTLRACNVSSYVYACREVVSQAIKNESTQCFPHDDIATVDAKFNSIILKDASLGEKVQIKSSTIGRNVSVGSRCRLNNVVVMDNVTIGNNCVLQNSVLSKGCTLGDNCNLNDCQLGPDCSLPQGTKGKSDSYVKDDME